MNMRNQPDVTMRILVSDGDLLFTVLAVATAQQLFRFDPPSEVIRITRARRPSAEDPIWASIPATSRPTG